VARPRIGIPVAQERARWTVWDQQAFLLPTSYVARVRAAGGRAILLAPDPYDVDHPGEALDGLDGLMLIGGSDLDPATYGAERDPATDDPQPERDRFEIALTREALGRDLPLLGICRGMQVIDVACGGTLIQHLPDDVGHGDHRRTMGSFDDADHDVRLAEGSLAARAAGETLHATKSHHHQGVATVGEGLVATGWSVIDDLVEVVEAPERRYALGVQWHPEADARSAVIASFVSAAGEGAPAVARRPARRRAAA
jgi:putative glutamine amidotransferase